MKRTKAASAGLVIGALGVIFGDIGTSPLYTLAGIFHSVNLPVTPTSIYGIISLIIWVLLLVVSVKYISFILRADNRGEGGIMALITLLQQTRISDRAKYWVTAIGLAGMALFIADGSMTPAISVLSAVEGIGHIAPSLQGWVIPIALGLLLTLFLLQSRGTGLLGNLFGPVMVVWLVVLALGGAWQIISSPSILHSLSPLSAVIFIATYPFTSFFIMGAVVLAITGAEAIYADLGHFGRPAIRIAWISLVLPALLLNYLGQGALLLANPNTISSPLYSLYPNSLQPIIILLATLAALVASQAIITGVFSLTNQAVQLGYAPRLLVRHTSRNTEGQIYVPAMNWLLCGLVCLLVVGFGTSTKLASAYGIEVSGALFIDTLLFTAVLARVKHASLTTVSIFGSSFLILDLFFVTSASTKLLNGAWVSIVIAGITLLVLATWVRGHAILARERHKKEQTLSNFIASINRKKIARLPGHAVYLGSHSGYAPLALEACAHQLHELHEKIVIVTVEIVHQPHVPEHQRVVFDGLHNTKDGISHVLLRFGFSDRPNVPKALESARSYDIEIDFNPYTATYFVSQQKPVVEPGNRMPRLQKQLYLFLMRNAMNASDYYHLPPNTTIQMSTYVGL